MAHESASIIARTQRLAREVARLEFSKPSHVYNPLQYAWSGQQAYLERYGAASGRVILLGMNPGPWGMAQTGVPFGDVTMVRNWFGIETQLARRLPEQHPKYPILGMACRRSEGSGARLWGWARERFGAPEHFFARFFVWNYCPLLFLADGRNMIPEKLTRAAAEALTKACDRALSDVVDALEPAAIVGIGRYAEGRARDLFADTHDIGYLLHPSPASPLANREWPEHAERVLSPWL
ncbi:MAG: single-stranded DNA-binding protein [Gammaproteobacteria bacterium]|nr:single-stranded DNA-binding protein [Gammaproteobacteria bacterium]